MFKIYLRSAVRSFRNNRLHSLVNVFGLTIGLCACMLVATVVIDDLSYDRQWSKSADLYRIITSRKMGAGSDERFSAAFGGLGPALKKDFPEVLSVGAIAPHELSVKQKGESADVTIIQSLTADTAIWSLLDIQVLSGNPKRYTEGGKNILISESLRNQLFQNKNPEGEILYDIQSWGDKPEAYRVCGVMKDFPENTHLRCQAVVLENKKPEALTRESSGTFYQQYILLRSNTDYKIFTAKVNRWYDAFMGKTDHFNFSFQPIKDAYLYSDFDKNQVVHGSITDIYIFSGVAILLLLIACINFVNLSTARVISRLHDTGVRKILGADKKHIIQQSLVESMLCFALSALLGIILYRIALPVLESYLGHELEQTFISHISLLTAACVVVFIFSIFTGIYPAWLLSRIQATGAFSGKSYNKNSQGQFFLRRSLVVLQFSISILVFTGMIVVYEQVRFMERSDIGFNRKNLLSIGRITWDGRSDIFKDKLLSEPGVQSCSITSFIPTVSSRFMSNRIDDPAHPGEKMDISFIEGDFDLAKTLGLKLESGRWLSPSFGTDAFNDNSPGEIGKTSSLITASTAKRLNIHDLHVLPKGLGTLPVGIINDIHSESMREPLYPTLIVAVKSPEMGGMLIRVNPGSEKQVTVSLQKIWKEIYPEKLLEANWVEDNLISQYEREARLSRLLTFFSLLTLVLGAMGVFGLVVHAATQRVKEIGIRRVLGASVNSIVRLLSSDFGKLVVIAVIIASPLSWWVMNKWLQNYAYRTEISWWMFGLAGFAVLAISWIIASIQAVRAAFVNPIESLRME